MTITDCMFSNCTSMYTISSCGNLPNVGSSVGGAVFTVGDAIITNCQFTSNTATPSQSEDDIDCLGSTSQRAVGFGGALTCNGNLNMSNCYLYGNNSANGGAMFIGGSGDYVSLTNCVFKENKSITSGFGNYGGAVNVSTNRSTPITFTGCLFESNAASLGGAILCPNENQDSTIACQFDDCRFSNNQATQNSGLPDLEPYGYGGSVCLAGPTNFIFTDCIFEGNGSWNDGGAINVQYSGSNLTMDGCELRSNSCGIGINGYGGAIRFYDEASGSFSDCDISNNTAKQYGGGISVRNGSYIQISNCTLTENTATNDDGGGIYFDSATGTVTYTTVFGNSADGDGGGIHIRDAVPAAIIDYCHVTNNTTGDHGGGIWAYSESDLSLTNTTACNNTSSDDDSTSQVDPDDYYCCGNTIQDTCSATCPGDLNFDGIMDVADLLILIAEWTASDSIQIDTLLTILSEFGQPCPD
ncbi:MAG: right-handed parallel beta-helix repeat-containing protein [Phycisphaerales bacterium]|nr:right-handed parallel beta-helix repeat-containing protein [Phycisphaerales bacterium]